MRREVFTESDLEIFYLRSKTGELVPVGSLLVEDYARLRRLEDTLIPRDDSPDVYSFRGDIGFTGTADNDQAQFSINLKIRLHDNGDMDKPGWVRIPLRLNQTILMPGAQHVGLGEFFVAYEKQGDGYVAWLRAPPKTEHSITMNIKLPVVRVAGRLRVSMLTPQRPTQLQLDVPGADLDVSTNNREENILTTKKAGPGKTRISVENVGGPLEITWREKNRTAPVLQSTGVTKATINGQQIDYESNLRVRSYGRPIESFEVRLPADAILIPEPTPGVTVEVVESARSNARLVRVTRQDGKDEPTLEVRLKAFSIAPDKVLTTGQMDLSGFDVVDAIRQAGSLDLAVVGKWTVDWFPGSYVRQVPLSESQRQAGSVAQFEYDRQPYSLKVEVRANKSRIRVAPTYTLSIEADQIRMVANFKYSASGARTRELRIQADGWTIDRVLPTELIGETISLDSTTPLTIPLAPNGTPTAEDFEIRVEAHQAIAPTDTNAFSVKLPRPLNGDATPAAVIVVPADNVSLRGEEIVGLISESLPADLELPKSQQSPLYYVEEPSEVPAVFAGDFEIRSRLVTANVDNTLTLAGDSVSIEQRFNLEISYEPLGQVKFTIPDELMPGDQIQFLELTTDDPAAADSNARETPLSMLEISPVEGAQSGEITVDLLQERIDPCTIVARFTRSIAPQSLSEDALAVPLLALAGDVATTVGTSKLRLVANEEVDVVLQSEGWDILIDDHLDPSSRDQLFQKSGDVAEVDVVVRPVQTPQLAATLLERYWLQMYLSRSLRTDRVCFQLRTNSEQIQVKLPPGAGSLRVAVDGFEQPVAEISNEGVVNVELGSESNVNTYTVEVWYEFVARDVPVSRLSVEPPTLVGVPHARRLYWQLILPRDEHLLIPPAALTPEYVWRWNSNHWGRQSSRQQADLETLMNASRQEGPPEHAVNQYVFTSVGPMMPVEFITASRGSLTLVLSLTVLVAGLCVIYFSWARHPASLLVVGVVVLSVGFVFPEPTILCVQAAGLGLAFILLARFLHRNAARHRSTPSPASGSSISMAESSDGFAVNVAPEGNSHTTTTLAPATYQVPIVEPKP